MTAEVVPIPTHSPATQAAWIGQATAIEQARAVAEVQAAIVVAQNIPRDMGRALGDMRDSCGRLALANRAFYTVPNRGHGPSVHLARELARVWGNIQYGVHELSQDLAHGTSEVQSFAWDVQTNTRSTRTFIVAHARMKGGKQSKLTDLGDIYLSNQNVGARAVRECIFAVLPTWFTEEARDICRRTLEQGEGKPLEQRVTDMIAAFKGIGVTVDQLEAKIGRKRSAWTASDVAEMVISFTSITRDGLSKDDEFPPPRVMAADILGPTSKPAQPPADEPAEPAGEPVHKDFYPIELINKSQLAKLHILFKAKGFVDRDDALAYMEALGYPVASSKDLTKDGASHVIESLDRLSDVTT